MMDIELMREKLRVMTQMIAELQAMLPDETPTPPRLIVVKDGDYDIGDNLPIMEKPSRMREGFSYVDFSSQKKKAPGGRLESLLEYRQALFGEQLNSKMKTREEATYYSQEEIAKMPKLKDGRFRITPDGYWQVRYRRDGYDIQFTSKDKKTVVDKFRDWVRSVNDEKRAKRAPRSTERFAEFAQRYFETVKAINVKEETYEAQMFCLRKHIFPKLGELPVRQITPLKCQELLNGLLAEGKGRTAEIAQVLLKEILRAAVGEKLLGENPINYVKLPRHQKVHGRALSPAEISDFIARCETSHYQKQFMLFLYTGIRRGELKSATFDENFVTVACGKCRKGELQQYRKIPIAPGLRKYLPLSEKEIMTDGKVMTNVFKRVLPSHQLYDLRHTFTTRAQECGVPKALVDVWTGHVNRSDMTTAVYTHFTNEFMIKEIEKLDY